MVGAREHLAEQTERDELHAGDDEQDREQHQRPARQRRAENQALPAEPREDHSAENTQQNPERSENVDRPGAEHREKLDGDQVENDTDDAGEPVLRCAADAWAVVNLDFDDARTHVSGDGGNEPVHFAVESQPPRDVAAEDLEHAAVVVNPVSFTATRRMGS